MNSFERGTVVVLTRNHRARLLRTLTALQALPEGWPIIVVDNGSTDGTAGAVGRHFPAVMLIRSRRNIGAAARNIAAAYAHTPYIAFTDDDSHWEPGALLRAARVLDADPRIAAINACVKDVGTGRTDPFCMEMSRHQLGGDASIGTPVFGLMPDACILRTRAFYEAGGVWPPLFEDGEEVLLTLDMAQRGWRMVYRDDIVNWRRVGALSTPVRRRRLRNLIWTAWMRLPIKLAWRETVLRLKEASRNRQLKSVLLATTVGAGKVLKRRHVVSANVVQMWMQRYHPDFAGSEEIHRVTSRQSVV